MREIHAALKNVSAVVSDLDRTLHRNTLGTTIGRTFLRRERLAGRALTFYKNIIFSGFANAPLIGPKWDRNHSNLKAGCVKLGLRTLFDALAKSGATKAEIYRIAADHIATAAIPQTHELLKAAIANHKKIFLTTTGTDIGPNLYSKRYKVRAWIGNTVKYNKGRVVGCDVEFTGQNITSAIEKMLFHHGLRLSDCAVIADDKYYLPAMRKAAVAIASPAAGKAVRNAADFCI